MSRFSLTFRNENNQQHFFSVIDEGHARFIIEEMEARGKEVRDAEFLRIYSDREGRSVTLKHSLT